MSLFVGSRALFLPELFSVIGRKPAWVDSWNTRE
jgi:hypothetical protein